MQLSTKAFWVNNMGMFGITNVGAYLLGVAMVILLPGPNSLYCLSCATQDKTKGVYAMLGILLGDGLLMLATALGVGTAVRLYPWVFHGIQMVGGAYLAYLGIKLLWAAWQAYCRPPTKSHQDPIKSKQTQKAHTAFYQSLSLSLTNPKAILFFLAFFVQFVEPNYPRPWLSFLILGLLLQIVSFCYLSVLIVLGRKLVHYFARHVWLKVAGLSMVGLLFCGFAIKMWWMLG